MTSVRGLIRALALIGLVTAAPVPLAVPGQAQPVLPETRDGRAGPPLTAHEDFASLRAGEEVRLFGYRLFDGPMISQRAPVGRVGPGYRLGPGDRLRVVWQSSDGTEDTELRVGVDATLIVPGLPPLSVLDLTLAEATAALERAADRADRGSRLAMSVTGVRQIGLLVVGEVAEPGLHQVPATASVLDVLLAAGGVRRTGSLRSIRQVSSAGDVPIDLYGLLLAGALTANPTVGQGDRIIVPPLGPTVGVLGSVARPGLFELAPGDAVLTVGEAIALAGGRIDPTAVPLRLAATADRDALSPVTVETEVLSAGDLLILRGRAEATIGGVRLTGAVRSPGHYGVEDLVEGLMDHLGTDAYPLLAIQTGRRAGRSVLRAVAPAAARIDLRDGDAITVLSRTEIAYLGEVAAPARPGARSTEACRPRPALPTEGTPALTRWSQRVVPAGRPVDPIACPVLFERRPDLLAFVLRHSVLVTGDVDRPGLYPVVPGTPARALLDEAGAPAGADVRVVHETVPGATTVSPGDILTVRTPSVTLMGVEGQSGPRPLSRVPSLRRVLSDDPARLAEVYPLAAVIDRASGSSAGLMLFSPAAVAAGLEDIGLADGDRVHLLPRMSLPLSEAEGSGFGPDAAPGDWAVQRALDATTVRLEGAVGRPGRYPIAGPVGLDVLIGVAGGRLRHADPHQVTVVSADGIGGPPVTLGAARAAALTVHPGDVVRVPEIADADSAVRVTVDGEVLRPGTFTLPAGARVSDVLWSAGGLTASAYPAGAVLLRHSAAEAEAQFLTRSAERLRGQLAVLSVDPASEDVVRAAEALLGRLDTEDALGRVVVEADPRNLRIHPDRDALVETGDRLHIPPRPLTVAVRGAVAWPSAQRFESGAAPDDYIRAAGGTIRNADRDRAFMVLPDGSAAPIGWNGRRHGLPAVPPGTTIIVPWRAGERGLLGIVNEITTILARTAVTAAAIDGLRDGE